MERKPKEPYGIRGAIFVMRLITRVASIGEKPLGVVLIGESGKGKSFLLMRFAPVEIGGRKKSLVEVVAEATRWGIQDFLISQRDRIDGGYLCFTDLTALSRRPDFDNITSWFLQSLEEGLTTIRKKNEIYEFDPPLHLGIIAAITSQEWERHKMSWMRDGFFQRLLQIRIDMSESDRIRVRHDARQQDIEYVRYEIRRIPVMSITVPDIRDNDGLVSAMIGCMSDLILEARRRDGSMAEEVFRMDKNISKLAMAAASFYTNSRPVRIPEGEPVAPIWFSYLKSNPIRVGWEDLYMVAQAMPYMVLKAPHDVHWYIMREFSPARVNISYDELQSAVMSKGYTKKEVYDALTDLVGADLLEDEGNSFTHFIETLMDKANQEREKYLKLQELVERSEVEDDQ